MNAAVPYPIGLPSGVGDCMWAVGKLKHAGPLHYLIADGWPYRTQPWFELLGPEVVASVDYGKFTYTDIVTFQVAQRVTSTTPWADLARQEWGQLLIEPNQHLEAGKPLADWLPDLPTDYHLRMHTSEEDQARAARLVGHLPRPITCISAASYRGSEAWKTWQYKEWSPFLRRLHAEVGGSIVLMGGFWDDLTASLEEDGYPCLVGKTSMGCAVEVLRHCDQFIGFSSGLGMLNVAMWGKTFLLWPDHQVALSTSWADPAMKEEGLGTYATSLWRDPDDVWRLVKSWLKRPQHAERLEFQR